ncbi:MazG nucleotide pyrophosphohydrolase domain-containing protein [Nocardioides yefusunii]|uniref:MazG nucleotide pyrophosphohydrolase domain-containing protein n=1 Tax=Nocardioides yefusunii TaxID=2500546 RepID=A0ABW1QT94_9ACTN|nr:MazG nucleotide pyrophosphohydrolase domain-containing protein [Nocardioides yefusunii]
MVQTQNDTPSTAHPSTVQQHPLLAFADLMRVLRDGCSWKQAQTHTSLKRFLLEESYETLEAIDEGEETGDWSHLREELGDVLLQVYFHAAIAEERGDFTIADVAADIDAKMRRRNPHVVGESPDASLTPDEVNALWQVAKQAEKAERATISPTAGIPADLPALMWASKVLGRLERGEAEARPEVAAPVGVEEEIGDALLALVERARATGVDAEQALRGAVRRRLPDAR